MKPKPGQGSPLFVIVELAGKGCLKTYLKQVRPPDYQSDYQPPDFTSSSQLTGAPLPPDANSTFHPGDSKTHLFFWLCQRQIRIFFRSYEITSHDTYQHNQASLVCKNVAHDTKV